MTRLAALAIVVVSISSVALAQSGPLLDANGRPYISSGPQPSPGDYTRERPGLPSEQDSVSPMRGSMQRESAFKDEYGFRYDSRGDRIDASGRIISPQSTTR